MAGNQAGMPQMDPEKMQMFNDLELEMMSDMYTRMTNACHSKCIPPKYHEPDLAKGEAVCLDRCVAKFLDIHERVGKKLSSLTMQDDTLAKQMQAPAGSK